MTAFLFDRMESDATFSACGRYRWTLYRRWDATLSALAVVMLNPSTADATKNDRTVAKVIKFARGAGHGGIVVVNLFAWRSTDPKRLPADEAMAVGASNDEAIRVAAAGGTVLCAWGKHGNRFGRGRKVFHLLATAGCRCVCLDTNRDGSPKHPLYVAGGTPMRPYRLAEPAGS